MRYLCFSAGWLMLINVLIMAYSTFEMLRAFIGLGKLRGAFGNILTSSLALAIVQLVLALLLTIILFKLPSWIENQDQKK